MLEQRAHRNRRKHRAVCFAAPRRVHSAAMIVLLALLTTAAPPLVIHAGTVLTRAGTPPIKEATIVVRDGRVESVQKGFVTPDPQAKVIDLKDRYVLPGLIDCHVHL